MICTGNDYKVESYKDYRNRAVTKQVDKLKHSLQGIKQCSLHISDKKNLLNQLQQMIEDARKTYMEELEDILYEVYKRGLQKGLRDGLMQERTYYTEKFIADHFENLMIDLKLKTKIK